MAYYIHSLQTSNRHLTSYYDTFMVAEHAFIDPRNEESDTRYIGDIMPVEFDPLEVERRIKVEIASALADSQSSVKMEMTANIEALNTKLSLEMKSLKSKVDAIKSEQDINDAYVKQTIEGNITKVLEMLSNMANNIKQTDTKVTMIENATRKSSPRHIETNGDNGNEKIKKIMEFKTVQNLEKSTDVSSDWMIWQLRLKNALTQVDDLYEYIINLAETITRPISSFENWREVISPQIAIRCGKTELEINKIKKELYTVLVDKCTSSQVLAFENDEKDGIYGYYSLYRRYRLTAGIGQIEKREFLIRPPAAKSESEVYDCIIAWEREVKEQEKLVSADSRPILSKTIKVAVLKNIATGSVKEYIKTHEAVKEFEELREEVLQMAMFNRTEQKAQTQKIIPMELNAVMDKLKGQMGQILKSVKEREFKSSEVKQQSKANDETNTNNEKFVAEINAMIKGKGKGNGVVCHNCGKVGHSSKECWSAKGLQNKGQFNWNAKGEVKGGGKGIDAKGGCFLCGGMHWIRDCSKGKGKGDNSSEAVIINEQKREQNEWENWQASIEYETNTLVKNKKMQESKVAELDRRIDECIRKEKEVRQSENEIMNVKGTWEKITFTGDSGAVDHVITAETGKGFEVKPTAASKAGFGFRAANGTPIKIFGERKLNGVTDGGDAFKMNCQVTDVKKNLASFVKMVNEGNDIVMSKKGSFIKNVSNGKVIKLNLDKGTPQFDVWVKKAEQPRQDELLNVDDEIKLNDSAFQRLEMMI